MDQEIWKDVKGYESQYQISNFGRVRTKKRRIARKGHGVVTFKAKILKNNFYRSSMYELIGLYDLDHKIKMHTVHRLVADAFIQNPENKPQVNHIDGIKTNNRVENLEWCTVSENHHHAVRMGLRKTVGETHYGTKFTTQDVIEMRNLFKNGVTRKQLAEKYNVRYGIIVPIINGRSFKHVL